MFPDPKPVSKVYRNSISGGGSKEVNPNKRTKQIESQK
jgi:hypothetical protein